MLEQFLALIGVVLVPVTGVLTALWITARRRAQRAESLMQQVAITLAARADGPAAALGPVVEALALEVDRIAEGQRFVTRLLGERGGRAANESLPQASITPH